MGDKKPCKQCPFRRDSLPGYLGGYDSAEHFMAVHLDGDQRNPCHMTVDYEQDDWKDQAESAPTCIGQAQMYVNQCKLPRAWKLPDVEPSDAVFRTRAEFIAHHQRDGKLEDPSKAKCYHCQAEVDAEDDLCHGCGEHICEECDFNHALTGPHEPEDHLFDPDEYALD